MKFKVGDIVRTVRKCTGAGSTLFPIGTIGTVKEVDDAEDTLPYLVYAGEDFFWYQEDMLELYEEKTYERGLEEGRREAWELARRIVIPEEWSGFSEDELCKVFGSYLLVDIFKLDIEKAIVKNETWEKCTKVSPSKVVEDGEGTRALVLDECGNGVFYVLTENGCVEGWHKEGIVAIREKTIDVSELVKRIGERENEVH